MKSPPAKSPVKKRFGLTPTSGTSRPTWRRSGSPSRASNVLERKTPDLVAPSTQFLAACRTHAIRQPREGFRLLQRARNQDQIQKLADHCGRPERTPQQLTARSSHPVTADFPSRGNSGLAGAPPSAEATQGSRRRTRRGLTVPGGHRSAPARWPEPRRACLGVDTLGRPPRIRGPATLYRFTALTKPGSQRRPKTACTWPPSTHHRMTGR